MFDCSFSIFIVLDQENEVVLVHLVIENVVRVHVLPINIEEKKIQENDLDRVRVHDRSLTTVIVEARIIAKRKNHDVKR